MGVTQWIFQRISNALIILFGLWLLSTVISQGGIEMNTIQAVLGNTGCRMALLALLAIAGLNSMLAGWQIAGDYAEKFGLNQNLLVGGCIAVSVAYIVVGVALLT